MNPFQTMNARMNTAAASTGIDPRILKAVAGTSLAASSAPLIGGAIDLGMGDTQAFNSGEIPLNYLIAALSGTGTIGLMAGSEAINKKLDTYYKGSQDKTKSKVSAHDPEIKKKMMEIHRTQGPDAAAAYFTSQKNAAGETGREGTYTTAGAAKRRMAGQLLSSLIGAGVSLPLMVDESYG